MRINKHPILNLKRINNNKVKFIFNDKVLYGFKGEPILVSLRANGVVKLRHSPKDNKALGAYCMQGRCGACMMNVNGNPNTMTCVTLLEEGMKVYYQGTSLDIEAFKKIPDKNCDFFEEQNQIHPECDIAVIGAGPAGLEASIYAAKSGVEKIILFDDKTYIGGQLSLQTHNFFGTKELGAGMRGFEIASQMYSEVKSFKNINVKLSSTVIGIYKPNILAFKDGEKLNFVKAKKIIVATGASEKSLNFQGNYLPGVIGAGAAQTFMNLYGVKPGNNVLIIGGGNIGVILAYQLLQAGISVEGVVEASKSFKAYQVHLDKIKNLGIKTYSSHTIVKAISNENKDGLNAAIISKLDSSFNIIPNTEKIIKCDTVCIAVGLNPLNELLWQAGCDFNYVPELGEVPIFNECRLSSNPDIFIAGDCAVIGEASIARLEGRLAGLKASYDLGFAHKNFDSLSKEALTLLSNIERGSYGARLGIGKNNNFINYYKNKDTSKDFNKFVNNTIDVNTTLKLTNNINSKQVLKQNLNVDDFKSNETLAYINCSEDIPCNPCEKLCPKGAISIGNDIINAPSIDLSKCSACGICIELCPGKAIRLVQYNYDDSFSRLIFPYEFLPEPKIDSTVELLDNDGNFICFAKVIKTKNFNNLSRCSIVEVLVNKKQAFVAKSIKKQVDHNFIKEIKNNFKDKNYVCRCEEITYEKLIELIDLGYTSINELRRVARIGMGPCRGIQCRSVIESILNRYLKKSNEVLLNDKLNRRTIFRAPIKRITLGQAARLNFSVDELNEIYKNEENMTVPLEIHDKYQEFKEIKPFNYKKCKIVIIGGGISGVCTAWELAKLGFEGIVVVEKEFLSAGATGAALGGIRTGFSNLNKINRAIYGLNFFKNAKNTFNHDFGWYQGGYVYLAYDSKTDMMFKDNLSSWKENNVKALYLSSYDSIAKYVPGLSKCEEIYSGVFFPNCGGANPFISTFLIAEDAKKMGVEFIQGEELVKIGLENNEVKNVVLSSGKKIDTDIVVNSAGSYAVRISNMLGVNLSGIVKIDRHESLITEKMPLWLDPLIVSYHPKLSGYWQQKRMQGLESSEGEIVACYTPSTLFYGYNTNSNLYSLSRMAKSILTSQANLENVGIVRSYAHHYVGRDNGIAIIGPSKVKGFWQNIAKKGHGFMCAPGDAHALAWSIKNNKIHEWISDCKLDQKYSNVEKML